MMRKYFLIALSLLFFASSVYAMASSPKQSTSAQANVAAIAKDVQVIAYYFHGNFRCTNCYNIEQYTKEAVEKYFQKELNAGKMVFKVINVEIKGNEHYTNDYQLYTKSVVLSLVKNGKEIKFDNLTKVWEYLRNKDAFQQYIKSEVEKYLKEP